MSSKLYALQKNMKKKKSISKFCRFIILTFSNSQACSFILQFKAPLFWILFLSYFRHFLAAVDWRGDQVVQKVIHHRRELDQTNVRPCLQTVQCSWRSNYSLLNVFAFICAMHLKENIFCFKFFGVFNELLKENFFERYPRKIKQKLVWKLSHLRTFTSFRVNTTWSQFCP